jgi:hypothetical protein
MFCRFAVHFAQLVLSKEVDVAEPRALASADRLLAPAVAASLAALDLPEEDEAAARLADVYARALDSAAGMEAAARKVLRDAAGGDEDLLARVDALTQALAARTALVQLGPKLESVLAQLGATPKGRAALGKKRETDRPNSVRSGLQSVAPGA